MCLNVHCHAFRKITPAVLKKGVSFSSLYYTCARLCISRDSVLYTCYAIVYTETSMSVPLILNC